MLVRSDAHHRKRRAAQTGCVWRGYEYGSFTTLANVEARYAAVLANRSFVELNALRHGFVASSRLRWSDCGDRCETTTTSDEREILVFTHSRTHTDKHRYLLVAAVRVVVRVRRVIELLGHGELWVERLAASAVALERVARRARTFAHEAVRFALLVLDASLLVQLRSARA